MHQLPQTEKPRDPGGGHGSPCSGRGLAKLVKRGSGSALAHSDKGKSSVLQLKKIYISIANEKCGLPHQ